MPSLLHGLFFLSSHAEEDKGLCSCTESSSEETGLSVTKDAKKLAFLENGMIYIIHI